MTTEKLKELHKKFAAKSENAEGAAKYLKEKAARCTDPAVKAVLLDLQIEAEEKAQDLFWLSVKLLTKYLAKEHGNAENNSENYIKHIA